MALLGNAATAASICVLFFQGIAAQAQAPAGEWSTVAKSTNGNCGDGITLNIVERPGLLTFSTRSSAGVVTTREVPLAPDGSGKLAYRSDTLGAMSVLVPAGKGKRNIVARQESGICQWIWQ
jgi:hypothetical protein